MNSAPSDGLRVLMTADPVGGVWTYAIDLIAALRPHGVRVLLATMGGPVSVTQHRQAERLTNLRLLESPFKLEWMDDPWDDVRRAGDWLQDLERQWRPDIIHLNGYAHGGLPFAAPSLAVAHSCCLSWWKAVKREDPPAFWSTYRRNVAAGLAGVDRVVAPSASMRRAVDHWYGPPASARVIHNGRPPGTFRPAAKRDVILAAGRVWDEAKNLATLASVTGELPWPVEIAGNAVSPDGNALSLPGVTLLGTLSEEGTAARMAGAAIYALPARYEPFGLSILEAALSGCALVLGDIDSLRELWADAAVYVDPERPADLADALRRLIERPRLRQTLAARSLRRAERYTITATAEQYLSEYAALVEKRPRSDAELRESVKELAG